jgi:CheY-like chemotaxis protein
VLLVEDDPDVLGAMVLLLEEWGLTPMPSGSMDELADLVGTLATPPALIIADYRLPGEATGANAVAFARSQISPTLPAIILTGDTAPERLREACANDTCLLHKPVQVSLLQQIVRKILAG